MLNHDGTQKRRATRRIGTNFTAFQAVTKDYLRCKSLGRGPLGYGSLRFIRLREKSAKQFEQIGAWASRTSKFNVAGATCALSSHGNGLLRDHITFVLPGRYGSRVAHGRSLNFSTSRLEFERWVHRPLFAKSHPHGIIIMHCHRLIHQALRAVVVFLLFVTIILATN